MNQRKNNIIKWILYSLIAFLLFILQSTDGLFSIYEIRPILIFGVICSVAFFENECPSAIFAAISGLFLDYSASRVFGFYAFFLTISALFISLLTRYLIRVNFVNFILLNMAMIALILHIDFFFSYVILGTDDISLQYFKYTLPTAFYSIVVSPVVFFIYKKIAIKFNKPDDKIVKSE